MESQLPSVVTFFTASVSYSLTERIKLKNKTLCLTYTLNGINFFPINVCFALKQLLSLFELQHDHFNCPLGLISIFCLLKMFNCKISAVSRRNIVLLYRSSYCFFQKITYPPVCIFLLTHTHTFLLGIPLLMLRIIPACCVNTCCDGAFLSVLIRAFPL